MEASKDFEELFAYFNARGVEYVIVGAHAVAFHAKPRYTKDVDVLINRTKENAARVMDALSVFGFGDVGLASEDFEAPGTIIQLGIAPNRIDIITEIAGVSFGEVWNGRVEARYGSQVVPFIGRAELIRAKQAAGRPQDLADLAWLQAADELDAE